MTLPDEKTYVEVTLIEQLKKMGWQHLEGDIDVPYLTERESFREVLLTGRLKKALREINLTDDGKPWLDDTRINQAVNRLLRISSPRLMEANREAFDCITRGVEVDGDPILHGGKDKTISLIDFDHPERNDFLAINQFRVDLPGGKSFITPDLVLFVNGIPLWLWSAKARNLSTP
jgi:type I restriction enzyme R subunit